MQLRQSKLFDKVESIILKLSLTQEMQEDSDPQPSDKDHPPSLGYSDLLQQHDTSPVDLRSTQEDVVSKYLSSARWG